MTLASDFAAKAVAFDTETHLIQPGLMAPPLVCGSVAHEDAQILTPDETLDVFTNLLASDYTMVLANAPFDMLVMQVHAARTRGVDLFPAIFAKYDRDQVFDVQMAEALFGLAHGHLGKFANGAPMKNKKGQVTNRYSLDNVVQATLGRKDAKLHDTWRLRYHELEDTPIEEWPYEARQYPIDDVVNTREAAIAQVARTEHTETNLHDLPAQVRAHLALSAGAAWGFRIDGDSLDSLEKRVQDAWDELLPRWQKAGFYRDDGSCDTAVLTTAVAVAYGADKTCPACQGVCFQCQGEGRVRGKRWKPEKPKFKICPNCKDGRPPCKKCRKTGLDIDAAPVPRAEKGGVSKGRDELNESGDETLIALADWMGEKKILETYVPYLKKGVDVPLTLKPDPLKETGRKSYGDVIDQLPRSGGVRDCFRARTVFSSTDYGQLELYTHAESCSILLGWSSLGDALNDGIEIHVKLAAAMGGISYEKGMELFAASDPWIKALRQAAKPGNYGFPGGMGAYKLVLQQRKQGPDTTCADGHVHKGLRFCVLVNKAPRCGREMISKWKGREYPPACRECVECAEDMRSAWFASFPENREYFAHVSTVVETRGYVVQHVSNRVRGGVRFTSAANGWFQGLAADGAKKALYRVSRECYARPMSPLYGSRVILFAHDEIIAEHPEDKAPEAADRIGEIMVETMAEYVPSVAKNLEAEPALMRRWYKGAKTVRDAAGRLQVWEP